MAPPFNPNSLSRSAVMEPFSPVHPKSAILSSATALPPCFSHTCLSCAAVTQVSNSIIPGRRFTSSGQSIPFVYPRRGALLIDLIRILSDHGVDVYFSVQTNPSPPSPLTRGPPLVSVVLRSPRLNLAMLSTLPSFVSLRQTEIPLELSVLRLGNRLNGRPGMYLFKASTASRRKNGKAAAGCNFPTLSFR